MPGGGHMLIGLNVTDGYDGGLHEIIRLFFPRSQVTYEGTGNDLQVNIRVVEGPGFLDLTGELQGMLNAGKQGRITAGDPVETKREMRCFAYSLLSQATSTVPSPYGILTGVRPTKLVHRYLDRGYSRQMILRELEDKYLVVPEKAELLIDVALRNRPYLPNQEEARRFIGVYIGIPYCPSRCHYCSFPGYPLQHRPGLSEFFQALIYEVRQTGQALKELNLVVDNLYIGGGTPTVLDAPLWDKLLESLHGGILGPETTEFTVEAGRPDTLKPEILNLLINGGVNRICVNPQTMNDKTLIRIGRQHNAQMIRDAFALVRQTGFKHINMDLIVGLPEEGRTEFEESLREVLRLGPESITVHHLSRKRGSIWQMQDVTVNQDPAGQAIGNTGEIMAAAGYLPYYLYRQKYMRGNQENIGYARPGSFSKYNIRIIEERQTIVGLGGGAASKFVNPDNWTLTAFYHPKDPATYINKVEGLINAQVDKLRALS
jgi:oxygen-independent coproporphyrinogen-3 oxidase